VSEEVDLLLTTVSGRAFYDRVSVKDVPLTTREKLTRRRWDLGGDLIHRVTVKSGVAEDEKGEDTDKT